MAVSGFYQLCGTQSSKLRPPFKSPLETSTSPTLINAVPPAVDSPDLTCSIFPVAILWNETVPIPAFFDSGISRPQSYRPSSCRALIPSATIPCWFRCITNCQARDPIRFLIPGELRSIPSFPWLKGELTSCLITGRSPTEVKVDRTVWSRKPCQNNGRSETRLVSFRHAAR